MGRFIGGFLAASALWGLLFALYVNGIFQAEDAGAEVTAIGGDAGVDDVGEAPADSHRGRRRVVAGGGAAETSPRGNFRTGDDLGENEPRSLDMTGASGEQQLSAAEVEKGMDGAFGAIRRCFMLAAGDEATTGRLVFGLRIEPTGKVSRVNLQGPAALTTGEAGECLRRAARGATFPSFDGPPMITHYPVTLE